MLQPASAPTVRFIQAFRIVRILAVAKRAPLYPLGAINAVVGGLSSSSVTAPSSVDRGRPDAGLASVSVDERELSKVC
jgi:hypothetical protein